MVQSLCQEAVHEHGRSFLLTDAVILGSSTPDIGPNSRAVDRFDRRMMANKEFF